MIPNWLYCIFVAIGFGIVIYYYLKSKNNLEHFADTSTSSIVTLPQEDKLVFNLNSFLKPSTYANGKWIDSVDNTRGFNLVAAVNGTLPDMILPSQGLNLKNAYLIGPSSQILNTSAETYKLGSFTFVFYAKIDDINFMVTPNYDSSSNVISTPTNILIYEMKAQTPNVFKLYLRPSTSITSVDIVLELGNINNTSSKYIWTVSKDKFKGTSGSPVMYGITADIATNIITLYIGSPELTTSFVDKKTLAQNSLPFTLAPDATTIHMNDFTKSTIVANVFAFLFYKSVLSSSDMTLLNTYLDQRVSGYYDMIMEKNALANEKAKTEGTLNKALSELDNYKNKLAQCGTISASNITPSNIAKPYKPGLINMPSGTGPIISAADLDKCSPLAVHTFGAAKTSADADDKDGTKQLMTAFPESSPERFKVPYPPNVTASTPSKAPEPAPSKSSSPALASDKSTSVNTKASSELTPEPEKDNEFWGNFFSFLKTQESKDAEISSDVAKKTETTSSTNITSTTVQDPSKKTEEPAEPTVKSDIWGTITNIFKS